jgi:hypothetical protein
MTRRPACFSACPASRLAHTVRPSGTGVFRNMDRHFFTVGCEERVHHEFPQLAVLEDGPSARRRQDRSDTGGVCDLGSRGTGCMLPSQASSHDCTITGTAARGFRRAGRTTRGRRRSQSRSEASQKVGVGPKRGVGGATGPSLRAAGPEPGVPGSCPSRLAARPVGVSAGMSAGLESRTINESSARS